MHFNNLLEAKIVGGNESVGLEVGEGNKRIMREKLTHKELKRKKNPIK